MHRFRISRLMVVIALLALDAGVLRVFIVEGNLAGLVLILLALQIALWQYLHSRRRFWLGFLVGGILSVVYLLACDAFPKSPWASLLKRYVDLAFRLEQRYLPTSLDDLVMDHQDWFFALIYFLPELTAAIFGGIIAACLPRLTITEKP